MLISVGLIRFSCCHILDPHEPIPTKFGLCMFFHHAPLIHGIQMAEMQKEKNKKGFL